MSKDKAPSTTSRVANKHKMDVPEANEQKDFKKMKTDSEVELMEKYNIVKGAMLHVVKDKVIRCLNYLCPIKSLNQENEHLCGFLMEDIMFCHVGLIQKFNMAYSLMKKAVTYTVEKREAGDKRYGGRLVGQMCEAAVQRGMKASDAERYCSIEVLFELIGLSETYSQIFEQLRAKLLALQECQTRQAEDETGGGSSPCLNGNFGLLHI